MDSVRVVQTKNRRFSPIVDRLYPCKQLLIYNSEELTYYGKNVTCVTKCYAKAIECQTAYYGGGSHGFFGLAKGYYTEEKIKMNVERIVKLVKG